MSNSLLHFSNCLKNKPGKWCRSVGLFLASRWGGRRAGGPPERGLPPLRSAGPPTALQENSAAELEHLCGAQLEHLCGLLGLLRAHGRGQRPGCGIAGPGWSVLSVVGGLPSCHSQGHFHTAAPPRGAAFSIFARIRWLKNPVLF